MSPVIIESHFSKTVESLESFFSSKPYQLICSSSITIEDGLSNPSFDVELHESQSKVILRVFKDDGTGKIVGTFTAIKKNFLNSNLLGFEKQCVQITAAYIDKSIQGLTLGVQCYGLLATFFEVLSDYEQTFSGAMFWKSSVSNSEELQVRVLLNGNTEEPNYLIDEIGNPLIYKGLSNNYDSDIWTAQTFGAKDKAVELGIDCDLAEDDAVTLLIASQSN